MNRTAILAVDEGTTGTRAALIYPDGTAGPVEYLRLNVTSRPGGIMEQDADEILEHTLTAIRQTLATASAEGIEVTAVGICCQRLTSVLWDDQTGRALAPAMVWQDFRYPEEMAKLAAEWDPVLIKRIGHGAVQSPYLWAAHHIRETEAVRDAHQQGRLRFGSIDSWLLWHLTGGLWATTASMAHAMGARDLRTGEYLPDWVEANGFPVTLLPPMLDDFGELGTTDPQVIGESLPIRALIGDQQAGAIGLGCVNRGQIMCVHGTGSFLALATGDTPPPNVSLTPIVSPLLAWRGGGKSAYAVESYATTTGSAVDWLCDALGLFASPQEVSALAATVTSADEVLFLPLLTGYALPEIDLRGKAVISGLGMATTKAEVAFAVIEGIAHAVTSHLEASQQLADIVAQEVIVGGGMAASDPLVQSQADLTGLPIIRPDGAEVASLRGAAFLAGLGSTWADLDEAVATVRRSAVFEPVLGADERAIRRARYQARMLAELALVRG